jgi:hypothetical protein
LNAERRRGGRRSSASRGVSRGPESRGPARSCSAREPQRESRPRRARSRIQTGPKPLYEEPRSVQAIHQSSPFRQRGVQAPGVEGENALPSAGCPGWPLEVPSVLEDNAPRAACPDLGPPAWRANTAKPPVTRAKVVPTTHRFVDPAPDAGRDPAFRRKLERLVANLATPSSRLASKSGTNPLKWCSSEE